LIGSEDRPQAAILDSGAEQEQLTPPAAADENQGEGKYQFFLLYYS